MREPRLLAVLLALAAISAPALAQEAPPPESKPAGETAADADAPEWALSAAAFGYFTPEEGFFVSPVVAADHRGGLHLEARYAYEERGAASLWGGWTFSFGRTVTLDLTPIVGGVFGDLEGIAAGVELDLNWKGLNFYYEGEYVHDLEDGEASFIYGWSELSYAPAEWFRAGLVAQRSRLYDTGLDVQRGLLVGFAWRNFGLTGYFFNPGSDDHLEVVALSAEF